MRKTKKWLALMLSTAMVLNTGVVPTAAAVSDDTQILSEDGDSAADGQADNSQPDNQTDDSQSGGQADNTQSDDQTENSQSDNQTVNHQISPQVNTGAAADETPTETETPAETEKTYITELSTVEDLLAFANNVTSGEHTYAGETVTLKNDIIAATEVWTPVGVKDDKTKNFQGTFDGQGHTITLNMVKSSAYQIAGMFMENYGTIQNLVLEGNVEFFYYAGTFAVYNYGTISNCVNQTNLTNAPSYIGGIVNENKEGGKILNCANHSDITADSTAGIAYTNSGTISGCFNDGALVGKSNVYGLVGGNKGKIENSYNIGDLSQTETRWGGAIGLTSNSGSDSSISNCYNTGTVTSPRTCWIVSNMTGVSNCYYLEGSSEMGFTNDNTAYGLKNDAEMRSQVFAEALGSAYKLNPNNGYPLLTWQSGNGTEEPVALSNIEVSHRTAQDSFRLTVDAATVGTLYYLIQDTDAVAPTAETLVSDGQKVDVAKGVNTVEVSNVSEKEQRVYLLLQAMAGLCSEVYQETLEKWSAPSLSRLSVDGNGELEFNTATRSVKAVCDTDVTDLKFKLLFSDDVSSDLKISYSYTDADGKEVTAEESVLGEEHTFVNFMGKSAKGNNLTIQASVNGESQSYVLRVVRRAVLTSLALADQNGNPLSITPAFDKSAAEYEILLGDVTGITFTVEDPTSETAKVSFNDTETEGNTYTLDLTKEKDETVVIKAVNGAAEQAEYRIQLHKALTDFAVDRKTETAKVTFGAGAAGKVYYLADAAGAEVTVDSLKEKGQSKEVVKGENVLDITGLDKTGKYLYICFVNDQVTSGVHTVNLLKVVDPYFTSVGINRAANRSYTATFDLETGEATVIIDADVTDLTMMPSVSGGRGPKADTYYTWLDQNGNEVTKQHTKNAAATILSNVLQKNVEPSDLKIYCTYEGEAPQSYVIHIKRRAVISNIELTDQDGKELKYTPAFSLNSGKVNPTLMVWDDVTSVNIKATDPTTTTPTFKFNDTEVAGDTYTVNLTEGQTEKVVITPVNGAAESSSYTVTIQRTLSDLSSSYREADRVRINATAGFAGEVYYLVQAADAAAPDEDTVMEKGKHGAYFIEGENELIVSGLDKTAQKVYLLLENDDGDCSKVYAVDVKAYAPNLLGGFKGSATGDIAFDIETKEATVGISTTVNRVPLEATLPDGESTEGSDVKLTYSYVGTDGTEKTLEKKLSETVTFEDLIAANTEGKDLKIVASKGDVTETYILHITREAVLSGLKLEDQDGNALTFTPEFTEIQREYEITVPDTVSSVKVTVTDPASEKPELLVNWEEITGPSWTEELETEKDTTLEILLNSEEAEGRVYTLTIKRLFTDPAVENRTPDKADVKFTSAFAGEAFYLLQAADAEAPDAAKITADGTKVNVAEGENTLNFTELKDTAYKLYLVVKNDKISTDVHTVEIGQYYPLLLKIGSDIVGFDLTTKEATYAMSTYGASQNVSVTPLLPDAESNNASAISSVSYSFVDSRGVTMSGSGKIGSSTTLRRFVNSTGTAGTDLKVTVASGETTQEYVLHVVRTAVLSTVSVKDQNGNTMEISPRFSFSDRKNTEYTVCLWGDSTSVTFKLNDPANTADPTFEVNGQEVKGTSWTQDVDGDKIQTVTIKAVNDAKEHLTYTFNLVPLLRVTSLTDRTKDSAIVNYYAGYPGDLYYLVKAADAEAPTAEEVMENGTKTSAAYRENDALEVTGLTYAAAKVYLLYQDDTYGTKMCTVDIPQTDMLLKEVKISSTGVAFDEKGEATVAIETSSTYFSIKDAAAKDANLKLTYKYTSTTGEEKTVTAKANNTSTSLADFLAKSGNGNVLTIIAEKNGVVQNYVLYVERTALLSALSLKDEKGNNIAVTPSFNKNTTEYTASVLDSVKSVVVTAVDPLAGSFTEEELANGASKIFFNEAEVNSSQSNGASYTMNLELGENKVVIKADNGSSQAPEYTLTITRVNAVNLTVESDPEDAVFALYRGAKSQERIWPSEDGTYGMFPNEEYNYTITKSGYVGQSGTLTLTESETKKFTLEKAPETELKQLESDYPGFRSGRDNMSVVSSKTPVTTSSVEVKWERQVGDYVRPTSGTTPIIVDNKVYTLSGTKLYCLDKETGEVLKEGTTVTGAGFALIPPTYADGMLFVLLSNGIVQCFNAETLESLWVYTDPLGGQCNSSIRYDNGYIYVGFFSGTSNFVCLSATDEDPSNKTEEKVPLWRNSTLGAFYWNGAWTNENYVIVIANSGTLCCLDKATGEVKQKIDTGCPTRCDISYYNGRIYFATQNGYLCSYNLTADGMIDTENLIQPLAFGGMSTSTPAIYNNRFYIGTSSGASFGVDGYAILTGDINPDTGAMSIAYAVPTDGYVQTSGLITKGYEEETGYIYVYFLVNSAHGTLYMIKDKAGLKEADPDSGAFYTPTHEQYCIASAVADSEGNLYLKNDSAWQFVLKRADIYLEEIKVTGGNPEIDGGESFDGSISDHTIKVDRGTESIKLELTATEGTEVYMNGVLGSAQDISLKNGTAEIEVRLSKGDTVRIYKFNVVSGPVLTSMEINNSPNPGMASETYSLDPEFSTAVKDYIAGCEKTGKDAYVWVKALNSRDTMTMKAVSGVEDKSEGDEIKMTTNYKGDTYFAVPYADNSVPSVAKVILTVTSADGTQSTDYNITLYTADALPILTVDEGAVTERTNESAKVTAAANKAGELYYLVQAADADAPDAEKIQADGQKVTVAEAGSNTLDLTGITRSAYRVYLLLKDEAGNVSKVRTVEIPSTAILGDLNNDGVVNIADVSMLLDKVTAGETVEPGTGDITGDGKVDIADVSKLLDLVTAGEI